MAALQKFGGLSRLLLTQTSRLYCTSPSVPPPKVVIEDKPPWPFLWMPGQYPKTKEERLKAAEKYGMHPDEYEPYDEDYGVGDYPKLPWIGYDARDPYYPWDMPEVRRNWNETMHMEEDLLGPMRHSTYGVRDNENDTREGLKGALLFTLFCIILYFQDPAHHRVMEKQYIDCDDEYYTFERV